MSQKPCALVWFRQDLRLDDNPALKAAVKDYQVLPVFILDDENAGKWKMGAAQKVYLHHSLHALNESLNNALLITQGDAWICLENLIKQYKVQAVFWNRCYEPWRIKRDASIKQQLKLSGVLTESFNASLLWEPWQVLKKDGTPYKVFTPYYRKGCLAQLPPREPLTQKYNIDCVKLKTKHMKGLASLKLLPTINWHKEIEQKWQAGEQAAKKKLILFLKNKLSDYQQGRNFPSLDQCSSLSPHLHFGELSPNQVWYEVKKIAGEIKDKQNLDTFLSELAWREFSYYLLFYFPDMPHKNFNEKFNAFPWIQNKVAIESWQKGETGFPLIDAGMRELWQTGFMHNRVRMVVASFLIKNQMQDWRVGAAWFWDCLVDADLASNSASWQWVAGSGADAAPYFRIFNPITQSKKFDPNGDYIRKYVPELSALPNKHIHEPWLAPEEVLQQAKVQLGKNYPMPTVDLKNSRELSLEAYKKLA